MIEPPMSQWRSRSSPGQFTIATGHQLWHWHPGILAKYYALDAFARQAGGSVLNLWVNHDTADATRIDIPTMQGDRLGVRELRLGPCDMARPTCSQPAIDPSHARDVLIEAAQAPDLAPEARLDRLIDAWEKAPHEARLDRQMAAVLNALLHGHTRPFSSLLSTELMEKPAARSLIDHMLSDAVRCVKHFNEAVAAHPEAGVRPLLVEPLRVELPLWALADGHPRRRVFADLSDHTPLLTLESGEPVGAAPLAPRALLLTALMRAYFCDLFIHGTGGGIYDQAMERWWATWIGEPLAPMAVVSADVCLPLEGVPLVDGNGVDKAVWFAHHLPHNLDRYAPVDGLDRAEVSRKRELLEHMNDDRDKRRRSASFRELQAINQSLAVRHADLLAATSASIAAAETGLMNQRIASRRDWCFALYPIGELDGLRRLINAEIDQSQQPGDT